ncbi:hypothetical protein [Vreelandella venusta]|uniref:hypothetical protein n=1 Tax=Vreelandella venusta TaxID=44935 RepID=UPI0018DA4615|nr:hypothetical protein [Halomonas venusta]QPI63988.1 hypothetical protein IR195_19505 [Halomonas venusta]
MSTPGGGSAPCPSCALERRIKKRVNLNLELFEAHWCRTLFLEFCSWDKLPRQAGNMTMRIDNYARFFVILERHTLSVRGIDQQHLFNLFGAEKLRRSFHVVNFLVEKIGIVWDNEEQEQLIENKRINDILQCCKEQPWHREIVTYAKDLGERITYKETPIKPLTVRNYLRAAIELLISAKVTSIQELPEDAIVSHVNNRPGHRASLTIFRTFAKEKYAVNLVLPEKKNKGISNKQKVKKIKAVIEKLVSTPNEREARALMPAAISMLYQLPLKKVLMLRYEHVLHSNRKVFITVDDERYELLGPLPHLMKEYQLGVDPKAFIFAGRSRMQPMSTMTVRYHIRKLEALKGM